MSMGSERASERQADLESLQHRLSAQLCFDENKQRVLQQLLDDNEDLRKHNIALEMENRRLQHTLDLDSRRHKELPPDGEVRLSDAYDWIVDIQLLSDVSKEVGHHTCHATRVPCVMSPPCASCAPQGWKVEFSGKFLHGLDTHSKDMLMSNREWTNEDGSTSTDGLGAPQSVGWRGAVVAVLGLYDKGKTFVLNNLTDAKLPSGKKVATKGLSFKHVEVEGGTKFVLLDSEGSYSPVKVRSHNTGPHACAYVSEGSSRQGEEPQHRSTCMCICIRGLVPSR